MKVLGFSKALLSRHDWVYLLSLLIPFVIYNLALKALLLTSRRFWVDDTESLRYVLPDRMQYVLLHAMSSDVFFILGYVLLWLGLFAAVRKGPLRWGMVALFHTTTILVVILKTCAYYYYKETGATLDYTIIALWLPRLDEIGPMVTQGVPPSAWVLLMIALF